MKAAPKRVDEFRRRLAEARERELRAAKLTDEELATSEPHQAGSAWEEASTQSTVDTLARLEGRQRHALDEIAAAQARLEAGTYGACEACGRPIALARLRALPAARLCAACQARTETCGREASTATQSYGKERQHPPAATKPVTRQSTRSRKSRSRPKPTRARKRK
jgi:RNA polymerase-binding protein DksA